jgi:hypothetical protein
MVILRVWICLLEKRGVRVCSAVVTYQMYDRYGSLREGVDETHPVPSSGLPINLLLNVFCYPTAEYSVCRRLCLHFVENMIWSVCFVERHADVIRPLV